MKRLLLALALAIAIVAAAPASSGTGKGGDSPTACVSYGQQPAGDLDYKFSVGGHVWMHLYAQAQWCYNTSTHVITSISNTHVGQGAEPWCAPYGTPYVTRYSGGEGNTWYTTEIVAWYSCRDHPGHLHSVNLGWAHNGWGNSSIAFVYTS
jgi:hypothetical protein